MSHPLYSKERTEPVWTFWRWEKFLTHCGIQILDHPGPILVTLLPMLAWLPTLCVWWKWKIRNKMWEIKHYRLWFQTAQFLYLVERLFQPSDLTLVCNHWETKIHSVNQGFSAFYWIQKVIAVFTRTFIGILSCATQIQPVFFMIHFSNILAMLTFIRCLLPLSSIFLMRTIGY